MDDVKRAQVSQLYYHSWLSLQSSAQHAPQPPTTIPQHHAKQQQPPRAIDRTLLALAQNVVLQLNVERCIISLIDDTQQHILVESTRSCSTRHPRGKPGDEVRFGAATILRQDAICELCLESRYDGQEKNETHFEGDGLIIEDCRVDERTSSRRYGKEEQDLDITFYAGVPLISPGGHKIGVLAALSAHSRDGFQADDWYCLQDVASCVMRHLEWAKDRADHYSQDRIIQGMARLVDKTVDHASRDHKTSQSEDLAAVADATKSLEHSEQSGEDTMATMYESAASILRECTSADGCIIFSTKLVPTSIDREHYTSEHQRQQRARKVLAASLQSTSEVLRSPVVNIEKLREVARQYPQGYVFESLSNDHIQQMFEHSTVLSALPHTTTVAFLPVMSQLDNEMIAAIFIWISDTSRRFLGFSLLHLHQFSLCIEREVVRINLQRDEAAKTTFIASMSHELRSPLHGILGAAEFLTDSVSSAYDTGLVTSIALCGKQLLDTLEHVLDHSKINSLRTLRQRDDDAAIEGGDIADAVNLSALIEESSEAITIGHSFKKASTLKPPRPQDLQTLDGLTSHTIDIDKNSQHSVTVLLDIRPRQNWIVKTSPGALQRVIMNLLGNALKFTEIGFVAVSLRVTSEPDEVGKLGVLLRVVDSGKGMSEDFQRERLFKPFSQEDTFAPGTGLGLSIVKQIIDDLGGRIHVKSQKDIGTEIDVYLRLPTVPQGDLEINDLAEKNSFTLHTSLAAVTEKTKGKRLILLDPLDASKNRTPLHPASRFQQNLRETCEHWFGMRVSRAKTMMENDDDIAIYLYGEPPPIEMLHMHKPAHRNRQIPIILACQTDRDAMSVIKHQQAFLGEVGQIVEVMQQPCGPRKLASVLLRCFERAEEAGEEYSRWKEEQEIAKENIPSVASPSTSIPAEMLSKSVSATVALPIASPIVDLATPEFKNFVEDDALDYLSSPVVPEQMEKEPGKLHGLIVDDNKINRQLLITFFKKNGHTYKEAENGQEAVDSYNTSMQSNGAAFDIILMDISMPVMDGFEATRQIRRREAEQSLPRTRIIAITGLGSTQAREDAEAAGVDLYLAKPVKFARLKELLR